MPGAVSPSTTCSVRSISLSLWMLGNVRDPEGAEPFSVTLRSCLGPWFHTLRHSPPHTQQLSQPFRRLKNSFRKELDGLKWHSEVTRQRTFREKAGDEVCALSRHTDPTCRLEQINPHMSSLLTIYTHTPSMAKPCQLPGEPDA